LIGLFVSVLLMHSMTFPALADVPHGFVLRHPQLSVDLERYEAVAKLLPWHEGHIVDLGFDPSDLRLAEQVHGAFVAQVDARSPPMSVGADGLITDDPTIILGIYVADCGAIYLHDPVHGAIGLVHSGKKGTELGIIPNAIEAMQRAFGTDPRDLIVQLSPCIRPPAYEINFADEILHQCLTAGIARAHLHDIGLCTSQNLQRFYSYRVEKGRTGRMLALLGL